MDAYIGCGCDENAYPITYRGSSLSNLNTQAQLDAGGSYAYDNHHAHPYAYPHNDVVTIARVGLAFPRVDLNTQSDPH